MNSRLILLLVYSAAICHCLVNGESPPPPPLEARLSSLEAKYLSGSQDIQQLNYKVSFLLSEVSDLKHEDMINKFRISALESKDQLSQNELVKLKEKVDSQAQRIDRLENWNSILSVGLNETFIQINALALSQSKYKLNYW